MNYEACQIRSFLEAHPEQFVSARVIARRVGGRERFQEDPQWANPILTGMVESGCLESNAQGGYRLRKVEHTGDTTRMFLSPDVRRILEQSGMDLSKVAPQNSERTLSD
jgi:hypothetical protein